MLYLKVKIGEIVQNEAQIGRKPSILMPTYWNKDKDIKFIPGETKFLTWTLTDYWGNIISEDISNVGGLALPVAVNDCVCLVGTFNTKPTKNRSEIFMKVTLA